MILIGLLLVAVAAGFTVDVFVQNTTDVDVDVLGRTFVVAPGWLVVAGITAIVVSLIGARLVVAGVARARRRRTALRSARIAERDRDRLAGQLSDERAERELAQRAVTGHDDGDGTAPDVIPDQTGVNTRSAEARGDTAQASN